MRRRRVLPWGALSHRELLNTARARAREPTNVLAEPGWWVGAQELRPRQLHRDGGVPADGDPYAVLTGAVATQVVALDVHTHQQPSTVATRVWVDAVRKAADAAASPDLMGRRRAGLRLLLALTDAAAHDPVVGLGEAVAAVLLARSTPEHHRAV